MVKVSRLTPKFPVKTAYGIITAALLAFTSLRIPGSEDKNEAYYDLLGRPAICTGHTSGVQITDIATDAQCNEFLHQDLFMSIEATLTITPNITENKNAFKAVGEFIMTTDAESYNRSPMAKYFAEEKWLEGCESFKGYMTSVTYRQRKRNTVCYQDGNGHWVCSIPELVKLRQEQSDICSGKI